MEILGKREGNADSFSFSKKSAKPGGWEFTFTWPPAARLAPLTLFLRAADLKARAQASWLANSGTLPCWNLRSRVRPSTCFPSGQKRGEMLFELLHLLLEDA
jgi:hypothetical protein